MSEAQEAEAIHTVDSAESSPQTKKKWKEIRFEQNKQILQLFYDKYPNCFIPYHLRTKEKKQPKPLAIGIHHKLTADSPEVPIQHIKNALSIYVSGWAYKNIIKTGTIRVDLQGNPTDNKVTEDEEMHAKSYLAKKIERKKATKEDQTNAAANKKKMKPTPCSDSKTQADNSSKSTDNKGHSQENTEVKLAQALRGRATLSIKKKEKPKEKETA